MACRISRESLRAILMCCVLSTAVLAGVSCAMKSECGSVPASITISLSAAERIAAMDNPSPDDIGEGYYELQCLCILGNPEAVRAALRLMTSDRLWGKGGGEQPDELAIASYTHCEVLEKIIKEFTIEKQRRIIVYYDWLWHDGSKLTDWPTWKRVFLECNKEVSIAIENNNGI